jgi:hypothetical protein
MTGKISELASITGANVANGDLFEIADISAGTSGSKSITRQELIMALKRNRSRSTTILNATTTTLIPLDNTDPQITEGQEALSVSITPISTTSIIQVSCKLLVRNSAVSSWLQIALFLNGGSNAIASATQFQATASSGSILDIEHEFVAGATSAQTLSIRFGANVAGTCEVLGPTLHNAKINNFLLAEEIHI